MRATNSTGRRAPEASGGARGCHWAGLWWGAALAAMLVGALAGCQSLQLDRPLAAPEATPEATAPAPMPPLVQAWRRDAEAAFGPEAPVATADGRIALGTRDGKVMVLDARTGSREGVGDFDDSVEGGLAARGPLVFVPLAKSRAGLVGHDVLRASRAWALGGGPHLAAPAIVGATLVAGAHDGTARGLDPTTGEVLWEARPDTSAQIRAGVVAAGPPGGPLAVVSDTEGVVRAYRPRTGVLAWTARVGAPIYRTPTASGALVIVPTTRGRLVALDAATGAERWAVQTGAAVRWATPEATPTAVFAGATDGTLRALDPETGRERWAMTFDGGIGGKPLAAEGVVYVGTYGERVIGVDAETGAVVWEHEVSGRVRAGLVASGGTLVVLAEPRFVYGFRPQPLATR